METVISIQSARVPPWAKLCSKATKAGFASPPTGTCALGANWSGRARQQTGYKGDSVKATQQHFIDCLRSGEPFETSAKNYLQTFVAVEAAYRSATSQRRVSLNEVMGATNSLET